MARRLRAFLHSTLREIKGRAGETQTQDERLHAAGRASFTGAKLITNVNERFLGGTNSINPVNLRMSRALSAADISRGFVADYLGAFVQTGKQSP